MQQWNVDIKNLCGNVTEWKITDDCLLSVVQPRCSSRQPCCPHQLSSAQNDQTYSNISIAHAPTTTLPHPFNGIFSRTTWVSRYQKGKTSLDLNKARDDGVLGRQWHQLDHMQTICTSWQTDNHTNSSSIKFYRPNALPDAQPTESKHWRHAHAPNRR